MSVCIAQPVSFKNTEVHIHKNHTENRTKSRANLLENILMAL